MMNTIDDKDILDAITERIFQFIEAEGLSYADFAASIDIGAAVVSHMKNGRNKVSLNVYAKILDSFPMLNPDWLLFGNGVMYRSDKVRSTNAPQPNLFTTQQKSSQPLANMQTDKELEDENIKTAEKQIKRIIVFYNDNSFQELMP